MVVKIIRTNRLSHLNLQMLSYDQGNGEVGEQILEALCATNIDLIDFNLSFNKSWWKREECGQLLAAFLQK